VVRVSRVHPDTIAAELGISPGTQLLRVNGRELADFLDWEFLSADEELVIDAVLPDGEAIVYEVERPEGEPFGLELEPPNVRRCANRCEFCFIEGLPKGLRKPLYMRDDDYRLSFAYGNFATLSNLKERDFERIVEYRLSPLYVSVHATPHEARKKLLNNPRVPNIVEQLARLKAGGIQFHGQMVVVPGLNDGDVLEQSLQDLWDLGDAGAVGRARAGGRHPVLAPLHRATDGPRQRDARARRVERWEARALRARGDRWVFGSDELYLLAGRELPGAEHYGDFPQIENGIGAVTSLRMRVGRGRRASCRGSTAGASGS
jgi:putative radical SAM enzyme (TIGR03279 family)